ncbi:MAG: C-GCAxxG-C-C family protein [Planctomycetia bacterium]|nr:C-GCAxxG-C-C family protein [Planctomycetia bacterium]
MTTEEKNLSKAEQARALFREGANCAQAVAVAFAEECHVDAETMCRLASGFGAGMGRLREVCGAVSGMVLVANLLWGPSQFSDTAGRDAQYARIQTLAERFRKETGSILCHELLGIEKKKGETPTSHIQKNHSPKRPCVEMVALAADILEKVREEGW